MKRIALSSLACLTLLTALAAQGMATPNPTSAVVKTRIFNDCPFSTVTVTNQYPSLISIEDTGLACSGFANLHDWSFSEDGSTEAQFPNNSDFRFSADVTLSGTGIGEGGLRLAPWWSPDADGKFMINATTGEIACFGGRLPFYSFTNAYGLHYVKGDQIHMQITYKPHGLFASGPATIEYEITYGGKNYASGELNYDEGNTAENPPHGLWGLLDFGYAGGYFQPNMQSGNFNSGLKATFANIRFVICPKEPDPAAAEIKTRVFNDCPFTTLTVTNNYPSAIDISDAQLACTGFANMHVWTLADAQNSDFTQETVFNNDEDFHLEFDYRMTGNGEGGIRVSPWWSHDTDGLFNVRSTDGEIACFGGRLPFYSFSASNGIRYHAGDPIHLGVTYKHNGLSAASPGTMQYDVVYNGTAYSSGPLNFDSGNLSEDPPHGLYGILNNARVGGHMKAFLDTPGDFSATTTAEFTNIQYSTGLVAGLSISPGSLNLKGNGIPVTAHLTAPGSYTPADFDVSTLRLSGVSAPIGTPTIVGSELEVQFSRQALQGAIQHEGGVATVTGDLGGLCFTATSTVRTFAVGSPAAGSVVAAGAARQIQWAVPQDLSGDAVDVFASTDAGQSWTRIGASVPNTGSYVWNVPPDALTDDAEVAVQTTDGVAIGISGDFAIQSSPVGVGDGPAVALALKGVTPNPSNGDGMHVDFSLPNARRATLALYDVSGRRVAFREVGSLGAGRHTVDLAQRLPAGMYVIRLVQDGRSLSARASVVR